MFQKGVNWIFGYMNYGRTVTISQNVSSRVFFCAHVSSSSSHGRSGGLVVEPVQNISARTPPGKQRIEPHYKVLAVPSAGVEDRHELQSKLETLESIGCTKDQVQECPEILLLSEREILQRFSWLRQCGIRNINVMVLKLGYLKSKPLLLERVAELRSATGGKETLSASLANKLQFNELEWYSARKKYIYLRHIRDMAHFNAKVDYLFQEGFPIEEIKKNVIVLNKSLDLLKERVKLATMLDNREHLTVSLLNSSEKSFKRWLQSGMCETNAISGFGNPYEMYAYLLGASVEDIREIPVFKKYSAHRLRNLIDLLLANDIDANDILCHPHILLRSSKQIVNSIVKLQELGFSKPSVVQMINVLSGRRVSKRQTKKRELQILANLLQADVNILEPHRSLLNPTLLKGKFVLRSSIKYLNSKGFDNQSIISCPIILGHDIAILKSYIETYDRHEDYSKLKALFEEDKGQLLNWIQYLIEKDINFSAQEAIAEEETEDHNNF